MCCSLQTVIDTSGGYVFLLSSCYIIADTSTESKAGEVSLVIRHPTFPDLGVCRCGASFDVAVVSDQFEGKRLLDRHRMVRFVQM